MDESECTWEVGRGYLYYLLKIQLFCLFIYWLIQTQQCRSILCFRCYANMPFRIVPMCSVQSQDVWPCQVSWCNGRIVRIPQTSGTAYQCLSFSYLIESKAGVVSMIHTALYVFTISIFAFCVSFLFLKDYLSKC